MTKRWAFQVMDVVEKFTGEYRARGIVVSRFLMTNSAERYVVEHRAEGGGSFCHIYSGANLRRVDGEQSSEKTK